MKKYEISVVVPGYNEEENLPALFKRLNKTLVDYGKSFEIIFANDGSNDNTEKILKDIQKENDNVVVINLFRRMGKAIALEHGFRLIRGKYIVVIDSDLQHPPEDIPLLIEKMEEGYDVVSGKRVNRMDAKGKIMTSKVFNWTMRTITGLKFDDYFSGLKCFRTNVINYLSLYGDLYRFAAAFAYKKGFNVTEIPVSHEDRAHGTSKYSTLARLHRAIDDLIVLFFSMTFSRERVYYMVMTGYIVQGLGCLLFFMHLLKQGLSPLLFKTQLGVVATTMIFVGIATSIFKNIADGFFERHYEAFQHRQKNIKNILRTE